jgi:ABC-type glucose/galactose transport system permease subunit
MEKVKLKKWLTLWNIFAIALVFFGFGMLHTPRVEKIGSLMIGMGSLYLILLIARSFSKNPENTEK